MRLITNKPTSLWNLYEGFKKNQLHLPAHQKIRGDVWPKKVKKKWWDCIIECAKNGGLKDDMLPGVIITFTLQNDENETLYINDGANRCIWSIAKFFDYAKKEGYDPKDILGKVSITQQTVEYKNVFEAMDHFHCLQMGIPATPYEQAQAVMVQVLHEDYDPLWMNIVKKIHSTMDRVINKFGCKVPSGDDNAKRPTIHKRYRDNLHLLLRFITEDKTRWSPPVAQATVSPDWDKDTTVEKSLAEIFKSRGSMQIEKDIKRFENFLLKNLAFYQQIWAELKLPLSVSPSVTQIRWWLAISIYWRNNGYSFDKFRELTKKLVKKTRGKSTIIYTDEEGYQKNVNCSLAKVEAIGAVCGPLVLDVKDWNVKKVRATRPNDLKDGFVYSHVKSFSRNGEGEVVAENAFENGFRGNDNMKHEEYERTKSVN